MKKKLLSIMLVGVMVLSVMVSGCGVEQENAAGEEDYTETATGTTQSNDGTENVSQDATENNKDITVVVMALNSDYWHMVEAGALIAGEEFGYNVSVIGPNAESNVMEQMNMIEDAITNKVAALVVAPNEPKAVIPSIQKAKDAGIPVIIIDAKLATDDTSLRKSFIGTGNYDAGKLAGEYLSEKLQPGDGVAVIRGLVGQPTHDERANGAIDAFEAAGMNVVAIQPADSDRGKAVAVAENIIQTNPDIKCFYATNDEMALGAYQAVEGARLQEKVIVMGFDGSFGALDSIAEGKLTASLAQKPIDEGYLSVKTAVEVLEGKEVEDTINNGVVIVDKSNVDEFRADIDAKMAQAEEAK